MKKLKILLTYISSNRVWIITLACLDLFFIFLAWLANPDYFINYVALIIFCIICRTCYSSCYINQKTQQGRRYFSAFSIGAGRYQRILTV